MNFLIKYERSYATKNDLHSRYEIFSNNYDEIEAHNKENPYVKKEINHFSDLTVEEFSNIYLSGLKLPKKNPSHKI